MGPIDADVIALTGLAGHAFGSWASTGRMWLRDMLPLDMPQCRVMSYGYDSRIDSNDSSGILFDHSNNFIGKLHEMQRQGDSLNRPLLFIGHSLGCLIIKEVLISLHWYPEPGGGSKIPPIVALVFIGAPPPRIANFCFTDNGRWTSNRKHHQGAHEAIAYIDQT